MVMSTPVPATRVRPSTRFRQPGSGRPISADFGEIVFHVGKPTISINFSHSKLMLFVPGPPRQRKSRGPGNGGAPVALRILAPRYDGTSLGTQNGAKAGHRGQKVVPRELNIVATGPKHLKNGVMGCQNGPTMTKNDTPLGPWPPRTG